MLNIISQYPLLIPSLALLLMSRFSTSLLFSFLTSSCTFSPSLFFLFPQLLISSFLSPHLYPYHSPPVPSSSSFFFSSSYFTISPNPPSSLFFPSLYFPLSFLFLSPLSLKFHLTFLPSFLLSYFSDLLLPPSLPLPSSCSFSPPSSFTPSSIYLLLTPSLLLPSSSCFFLLLLIFFLLSSFLFLSPVPSPLFPSSFLLSHSFLLLPPQSLSSFLFYFYILNSYFLHLMYFSVGQFFLYSALFYLSRNGTLCFIHYYTLCSIQPVKTT
jgi:hypothetical protein